MSTGRDREREPGRGRRGPHAGKADAGRDGAAAPDGVGGPDRRGAEPPAIRRRDDSPRGLERLADLLPRAAREYGLEDQLDQARAAAAWERIVAERVPAAVGACRLVGLRQGVATIEIDMPIVAQEIRLRSPQLLAALRSAVRTPVLQLQLITRHV
jgi:predicted nucleic acid-binding Zn ribbon protein